MRVTLAKVNAALKAEGADCELVKGRSYFYFRGPGADRFAEQGVYVYHLSDLTVEEWVAEWRNKKQRAWENSFASEES